MSAIIKERDVPGNQRSTLRQNAELAAIWPNISEKKVPSPDAEEWHGVPDKPRLLERQQRRVL